MLKKYVRWLVFSSMLPLAGGVALLMWLLSRRRGRYESAVEAEQIVLPVTFAPSDEVVPMQADEIAPDSFEPAPAGPAPTTDIQVSESTVEPDDLTRIEGIGPKIAATLQAAGVLTFAQLAVMDQAGLIDLLKAGGIRVAFPETWPEQATLAAVGDWDGLAVLQGTLKGGRRV